MHTSKMRMYGVRFGRKVQVFVRPSGSTYRSPNLYQTFVLATAQAAKSFVEFVNNNQRLPQGLDKAQIVQGAM